MTQTTFTDNVLVDGSQDIKQLRVQGHTTQNQPLQTWENSAGNTVAQVTGDGRLIVGDDVTPDSLFEAHRLDTSTSKPTRGIHSLGQVTGTLNALVQWIVGELELTGASAISALHTALRIRASNKSTVAGSAGAEVRGADIEVINDTLANAAAFPKATGMQVTLTNASGKAITDAIGLKVKMNNSGTITNPFSIYTEGPGPVHLEDYVEVKRPASVPGTPATDFERIYPKADGKLYAKGWDGIEYELTAGTIPNGRKSWLVTAAAATVDAVGMAAPTVTGATVSNDTDSTYINFATTAVLGNISGLISATFNLVRLAYDPTFIAVVRTGADITNLRFFLGLFPSAPTNADTPPNNSICFRYSAPAADGGWRGICRDAAAQTVSAQIGPTLAANTRYMLKFRKQGSTVYFSVDNGPETAISTNLPVSTTDLGFAVRVITNVAVIKNLKLSRLQCDFN